MKVESRSVVYRAEAQPESRRVAFFDSLLRTSRGSWICGFTAGQSKHHPQATIYLCRSTDGGETWNQLEQPFDASWNQRPGSLTGAELVEVAPGRLLLFSTWFDRSEPERPLFDPVTEGILRSRQLLCESTDEGSSWGPWREVPTPGLTGCALTGPVLRWDDGVIGLAFESFKEFDDPTPTPHGSWLLVSRDQGATFEPPFLVARDPQHKIYYWDQRLCSGVESAEWIGMFWTHDRGAQRDRRVHFLRGRVNGSGPTAGLPRETNIPGQIAAPLLWRDGRILAFVVDRDRPGTLRLWTSRDGGASWPEEDCLTVHTHEEQAQLSQGLVNIDYAQFWEDMGKWTFGHPCIRPFDNERVMLSYYAGVPQCLSIHAAVVNVSEEHS